MEAVGADGQPDGERRGRLLRLQARRASTLAHDLVVRRAADGGSEPFYTGLRAPAAGRTVV
jgi:hypothetical protein